MVTGHNFESILPKDHSCHVCFKLADWFQKRRLLNNFPIGFYVKTMSADGGHLVWGSGSQDIILVVSNKKIFKISTNQNTLWALAAMLDFRSAPKTKILYMTIQ